MRERVARKEINNNNERVSYSWWTRFKMMMEVGVMIMMMVTISSPHVKHISISSCFSDSTMGPMSGSSVK